MAVNATEAAEAPVGLGTAASFAVLAGAGVSNTGPTVVTGDLGTCPTPAVTGFPPGSVSGTLHADDAVACNAKSDLTIAYNDAAGRPAGTTFPGPTDLGGMTLTPGVYGTASSLALTGTLTLDGLGDPNAVFLFQAGSTLITAPNSHVVLINGAQACNVFWQVGSSATLGVGSSFVGTILALTSITVNTNAVVAGRVLARNGAITLDSNTISAPCAPVTTTSTTSTSTSTSSTSSTSTTLAPSTTTSSAPTTTTQVPATTTTSAPAPTTTLAPATTTSNAPAPTTTLAPATTSTSPPAATTSTVPPTTVPLPVTTITTTAPLPATTTLAPTTTALIAGQLPTTATTPAPTTTTSTMLTAGQLPTTSTTLPAAGGTTTTGSVPGPASTTSNGPAATTPSSSTSGTSSTPAAETTVVGPTAERSGVVSGTTSEEALALTGASVSREAAAGGAAMVLGGLLLALSRRRPDSTIR